MIWQQVLPLLIVVSALVSGLIIFRVEEHRQRLRTILNLGGALVCISLVGVLIAGVNRGDEFETRLALLPNIDLVLHADALSLLFVSLSAVLWLVTTIYAIGYLRNSPNRSRFFGFFSLCVSATMGVALAGNLITFLIFYELLTLATYPLVMHKGNAASLRAGRTYLIYTMIGGALLMAGVVWLKVLAGPLDFTATGILSDIPGLNPDHLTLIFILLIAGLGVKAALVPLHGWLPVAMAAPAPVSALLHAVAVVKAGAFGIIRVVYDVYGIEFARALGLTTGLAAFAALTIIYGSTRAVFQNDLKKRLAYSTISQVSYIALGTAIAGPIATIGGIVHLVHQGLMKITMFFCAGNLAETLGVHKVSEMAGAGQRMPLTMTAFSLAALGMIGIPPAAGFVSKWYLGVGAIEVEAYWIIGVLAISSLLNAAYFLPILYAAWFKKSDHSWPKEQTKGRWETHWMLLLPPLVTVFLAVMTGVLASSPVSPLNWVKLIAAREYGAMFVPSHEASFIPQPMLWWIVILPLLSALGLFFKPIRRRCLILMPLAAAPSLLAAWITPLGDSNSITWLFFGSVMGLDSVNRSFLILAGTLWSIAGAYAVGYLKDDENRARFTLFFLLTMSGNFGLILAQDLFGFISFFTLMSLSAYGLVIHSNTDDAKQAAKTYIQWVVIGEVLLFAALTGLAFSGGATTLSDMELSAQPYWVTSLLLAGFGVKAGLLTFHVWLPRAHPAAPIPASALLSGIMVKAGLLGWIRFVPLGEVSMAGLGNVMIVLGLTGAFSAVFVGIVQRNPKAVLAYSTISQMGIISAAVGAGMVRPEIWPFLQPALLIYAVHHGLAKAALFLSVDLAPRLASQRRNQKLGMVCVLLPAIAIVGLPLTSGGLAKSALKTSITDFTLFATLLPITAIGTSLLMLRFLDRLKALNATTMSPQLLGSWRMVSYCVLLIATLTLVYILPESQVFLSTLADKNTIWNALWPPVIGLLLYQMSRRYLNKIRPIPAGDMVIVMEISYQYCKRVFDQFSHRANHFYQARHESLASFCNAGFYNKVFSFELITRKVTHPGIVFLSVLLTIAITAGLSSQW